MAHEICLPRLGWSMEEGTFIGWLKSDGDDVRAGDPLFEIEGDKGVQEIEAADSGILRVPPNAPATGSTLAVGTVLGYLLAADEAAPWEAGGAKSAGGGAIERTHAAKSGAEAAREVGQSVVGSGTATDLPQDSNQKESGHTSGLKSSPRSRRVARELGIDLRRVRGTGREGRIREVDVRRAATVAGEQQPRPPVGHAVRLTPRRRTIAQRMQTSRERTVPVTLTTRADVTRLVTLRAQFRAAGGVVPTYTDIVTKLAALVLVSHPEVCACWCDDHLELPGGDAIDIGIAVDVEDGLVVPVLRDVARLTLDEIVRDTQRLVALARDNRLTTVDMQGGVFTVTNLGGYGIDAFTPIIHYPQTAILGLGAIRREPVVLDGDAIAIRDVVTLNLTFDHCAIDGAPAARFLRALVGAAENPTAWLGDAGEMAG